MRERIEDLGRIAVLIDNILELDIWDKYQGRNKYFIENFRSLDQEKQDDLLHGLIYGISIINDKLHDISSIAEGTDRLNEKDD